MVKRDPFIARKPVRQRVAERPVTVGTVVLGLLMYVATLTLGDESATALYPYLVLVSPVIAGWIIERFTFSQSFIQWAFDLLNQQPINGNAWQTVRRRDRRLNEVIRTAGTNNPRPGDSGLTALEAVVLIFVVLVIIIVLFRLFPTGR